MTADPDRRAVDRTRVFDDLDRLAFRLQRMLRERLPEQARQAVSLGDLEERLIPYRDARRELAESSPDGYERTVLRLLVGERGYLAADPRLQEACRQALASPSPTLALVRAWSAATVTMVGSPGAHHASSERQDSPRSTSSSSMATPFASPPPHGADDPTAPEPITCRYCACALPRRPVTFCPMCGMDLTRQQCPACSTELEVGWRFCVSCGRRADPS